MKNPTQLLAMILALAAGTWSLLRAYRRRSVQTALRGIGFVALGLSFGAIRLDAGSASMVFSILSIATFLAMLFWREPVAATGEPRDK